MKFDRQKFFDEYKRQFGSLTQIQVDGLNGLLWGIETYWGWWDDLRQTANALAQVKLESAHSFQPVVEAYYLGNPKAPGFYQGNTERVRAVQKGFWYYPFFGRGHIQLTHRENHQKLDAYIRKYFPEIVAEFEMRARQPFDLVKFPDQALDPKISFCVLTLGMHLGLFRAGQTLDRYINPVETNHFGAREIVNGDKNYVKEGEKVGDKIVKSAKKFEKVLRFSLIEGDLLELEDEEIEQTAAAPVEDPSVTRPILEQDSQDTVPSGNPDALQDPNPSPAGSQTGNAEAQPPAQSEPPKEETFQVEDVKPFVFRWLKTIWKTFGGISLPQFSAFTGLGVFGGEYWYYWIIAGVLIFLFLFSVAVFISLVLGVIWYVNRREINRAKEKEALSKLDPSTPNLKLVVEKKL